MNAKCVYSTRMLLKPFEREELIAIIRNVLGRPPFLTQMSSGHRHRKDCMAHSTCKKCGRVISNDFSRWGTWSYLDKDGRAWKCEDSGEHEPLGAARMPAQAYNWHSHIKLKIVLGICWQILCCFAYQHLVLRNHPALRQAEPIGVFSFFLLVSTGGVITVVDTLLKWVTRSAKRDELKRTIP